MGYYTIFYMFENPRRGRQARNFTTNVPKIVDRKSSSEKIFLENCRWVPLIEFNQAAILEIYTPPPPHPPKSRMVENCPFGLLRDFVLD